MLWPEPPDGVIFGVTGWICGDGITASDMSALLSRDQVRGFLMSVFPFVGLKGVLMILLFEFFSAIRHLVSIRHVRIGIANPRQISGARLRVQKVQHVVIALLGLELGHAAFRVGDI